MTLSLNVLSPDHAEILRTDQAGSPKAYAIKGPHARGIIAMYEHLMVCEQGGEVHARTYLTGVAAGISYETIEQLNRSSLIQPSFSPRVDP